VVKLPPWMTTARDWEQLATEARPFVGPAAGTRAGRARGTSVSSAQVSTKAGPSNDYSRLADTEVLADETQALPARPWKSAPS